MVRNPLADDQSHGDTYLDSVVSLEEELFVFLTNFILYYSIPGMQCGPLACVNCVE